MVESQASSTKLDLPVVSILASFYEAGFTEEVIRSLHNMKEAEANLYKG